MSLNREEEIKRKGYLSLRNSARTGALLTRRTHLATSEEYERRAAGMAIIPHGKKLNISRGTLAPTLETSGDDFFLGLEAIQPCLGAVGKRKEKA